MGRARDMRAVTEAERPPDERHLEWQAQPSHRGAAGRELPIRMTAMEGRVHVGWKDRDKEQCARIRADAARFGDQQEERAATLGQAAHGYELGSPAHRWTRNHSPVWRCPDQVKDAGSPQHKHKTCKREMPATVHASEPTHPTHFRRHNPDRDSDEQSSLDRLAGGATPKAAFSASFRNRSTSPRVLKSHMSSAASSAASSEVELRGLRLRFG
jgi:hypothetical protein